MMYSWKQQNRIRETEKVLEYYQRYGELYKDSKRSGKFHGVMKKKNLIMHSAPFLD